MNTTYVPAGCNLETWSGLPWTNGVQLGNLRSLDTLEVTTKNTVYEITVMDASTGDVLVRGGRFFPALYARAPGRRVAGRQLLKLLGIYVGFSMEFYTDDGAIVTTRVREIAVVNHATTSP